MAVSKSQRDILNTGLEAALKGARANLNTTGINTDDVRIVSFRRSPSNKEAGVSVTLPEGSKWTNFKDIAELVKSFSPRGEVVGGQGQFDWWVAFTI